jgi:uncharacterized protein YceK
MSAMMWNVRAVGVVVLVVLGVAGCGSANGRSVGTPTDVVARVGTTVITHEDVDHWMRTVGGGDFYDASSGYTLPTGLVADPPNYGGCVARLQALAPRSGPQSKIASVQLLEKCRQLYQALKQQAMSTLIDFRWTEAMLGEEGIHASESEVRRGLVALESHLDPEELPFARYLARHSRSLADQLEMIKLETISDKATERLSKGGRQAVAKLLQTEQRWTAKTSCSPGYVVAHCAQYTTPPPSTTPSPDALLAQVAKITN